LILEIYYLSYANGRVIAPDYAQAVALAHRLDDNARRFNDGRAAHVQVAHGHCLLQRAIPGADEETKHGTVRVLRSVKICRLGCGEIDRDGHEDCEEYGDERASDGGKVGVADD
jgi:hypothetical protein